MLSGTVIPTALQQALASKAVVVNLNAISALPQHTPSGIRALQQADPVIKELLRFWRRRQRSNHEERQQLSPPVLALLRQWGCLVEKDGVLYCQVFRSDGGEAVLQLLLPMALTDEVLTQLHQEHGLQGVE